MGIMEQAARRDICKLALLCDSWLKVGNEGLHDSRNTFANATCISLVDVNLFLFVSGYVSIAAVLPLVEL